MSLRVLQVIPSVAASDGGPTRAIQVIEQALSERGVSVKTLTTDYGLSRQEVELAGQQRRIVAHHWTRHYKIAPSMVPYLWQHATDFDIFHIHALFSFACTAAAWIARMRGIPYVLRPLGTLGTYSINHRRPLLKRISLACNERQILRNASAVHFTSYAEEAEMMGRALISRSAIIPLGVTQPIPATLEAVAALAPAVSGRQVILFLARLDPKKNVECLIDAMAASHRLRNNCRLVVAGDGDPHYVASLKARAEFVGIANDVVWLGHVAGDRKAAVLSCAHVFVLPSHSENFGIAAVEAMLAGVPCILSPGVAVAQEVAAAGGGEVVGTDPTSLADAIERVVFDDTRRLKMGKIATAYAKNEFSVEAMADRLIELYSDIKQTKARRCKEI